MNLASALPFIALILGLLLTATVGLGRKMSLDAEQTRVENSARQEFGAALENSAQQVGAEADRVFELVMGITAFASSQDALTQSTIDEYLLRTNATVRFTGLGSVVVTSLQAEEAEATPAETEPVETEPVAEPGDNGLLIVIPNDAAADPVPDVPEIAEQALEPQSALSRAISAGVADLDSVKGTALAEYNVGGVDVTVVHFAVATSTETGWVSLVFEGQSFLARALRPVPAVSLELLNTGEPMNGPVADLSLEEAALIAQGGEQGQLIGEKSVDVFGTDFVLSGESTTGFVPTVETNEVLLIWIFGGLASIALFAMARALATGRSRALERARASESEREAIDMRFRASFQNAPIGMAEVDGQGRLVSVNEAFAGQAGSTTVDLEGRSLSDLVHPSDRTEHLSLIHNIVRGERDAGQSEHRYRHGDGRDVWVNESISVIDNSKGGRALLVQTQDVTARRRAAWELARQALHDDLTGLPNRALFLNRLNNALDRAGRNPGYIAVMFIDVDRFKVINDSLGHETGDQFLIEIAERVGTAVRTGDTVARFGGDEFVVLCENVDGESEANLVAQRIQRSFAEPFILSGQQTFATVSVGITLSRGEGETADTLLRDSDAAMYRAKEGGRNRTEIFNHAMRSSLVARMEIESQLRDALENGEMVLHYQAIVDPVTFLPAGYEALIRWNHPEKGLLGPGAFLPVAEDAGLIHLVDSFVLRSTCRQIAEWSEAYSAAKGIYVSVNWSARHLGAFVQQVEQILSETGIAPEQLVIEVTEGFLLEDSDGSLKTLKRLKALGVAIAIDDFGTGYSSLSYLTRLDVDYLKIDQSFVSKLPEDQASAAVIGAIADMANRLDIKLIAEGVETDAQMHMLASLGSPRLQGYRFAKPRPANHIAQHLAERSQVGNFDRTNIDPESPRVLVGQPTR